MKRFLVALSLLSLVCAVMAVPVFAYELVEDDYGIDLPVIPFDKGIVLEPSDPAESEPAKGSIVSGVTDVFGGVGSWIVGQIGTAAFLFWDGQSLTFLGVLSVCALALAVILLLIFIVVRFLRFGG